MTDFGDYKNNPLWTDITHLHHLSPQPGFGYQWNRESGRWEPDQSNLYLYGVSGQINESNLWLEGISGVLSNEIKIGVDLDHDTETHKLLSGISGVIGDGDKETHKLLSGISGELTDLYISDKESHRILSGISGELSDLNVSDSESHRILSGISGELSELNVSVDVGDITLKRSNTQPWKLRTKTVNQKIEEDFFLLESIPDEDRYGTQSGTCYGTDKSLMDDIYGTYFDNARMNPSNPETGHPNFFIHPEDIDPARCVESTKVFHTDTRFGFRQENAGASDINSYELEDYNELYERGLVESVTIFNESPYPLQFHTSERKYESSDPTITETQDLIYLDSDTAVKINNDEAGRIFVKRPHTISGYTVKYAITYKSTGLEDVIS